MRNGMCGAMTNRASGCRAASLYLMLGLAGVVCAGCTESLHDMAHREDLGQASVIIASHPGSVGDRDRLGKTPLHFAVTYDNKAFAELLLSKGADVNAVDGTGMTALHAAGMLGRDTLAEVLLRHGASVDARDAYGDTALHLASIKGQTDVMAVLLEGGADLHAKNSEGKAPLDLARRFRKEEAVQVLEMYEGQDD